MIRLDARRAVVALLALLLAPAALAAGVRTSSISTPDTPEARFGAWIESLQEFAARNPELTPEQAGLVFDAQRAAEPRLFADRPGAEEAEELAASLGGLRSALSCGAYADLVAGFGELRPWLEQSEVLAAAASTCNCGSDSDCASGYTCDSITCTSQAGTTHWGLCRKTSVSAEPVDPVEPSEPVEPAR